MTSADEIKRIAEEAHKWQAMFADGPLSEAEQVQFDAWVNVAPEHRQAFERAKTLWTDMSRIPIAEVDPALSRPLMRERVRALRDSLPDVTDFSRQPAAWFGSLAVVVLLLMVGVPWTIEQDAELSTVTHRTGIAEIKEIVLNDGSTMALGAVSVASVQMDDGFRRIVLKEGEAFFDVAPDTSRPFTVTSGDVKARAVGTSFLFSRRTGHVQVAVAEGIVDVASAGSEDVRAAQGVEPQTAVRLTVGEQVTATIEGELEPVAAVDVATLGAWRTGRLIYVNAPLSDLVADANRYSRRPIYIADHQTANLPINAAFDSDDIDGMLKTLQEALPITLRHYPDSLYIEAAADANTD